MKTLIVGGVRSGKSRLAERLAGAGGLPVTYIATARVGDEGMRQRMEQHRALRPAVWSVVEEPQALAGVLAARSCQRGRLCAGRLPDPVADAAPVRNP